MLIRHHGRESRAGRRRTLHLLPTLWFRNTWSWGRSGREAYWPRGRIARHDATTLAVEHATLGTFRLAVEPSGDAGTLLFTENETNAERLFGAPNASPYVKDAFHRHVDRRRARRGEPGGARAPRRRRTTGSTLPPGGERVRPPAAARRGRERADSRSGATSTTSSRTRIAEADAFYDARASPPADRRRAARRCGRPTPACSGRKQFYHYVVRDWLDGRSRASRRRRAARGTAATRTGSTSTTATSSRCPTSGSIRGTRRGTSRST